MSIPSFTSAESVSTCLYTSGMTRSLESNAMLARRP